ncbi:helix-turn-helix domain-containing protein [Streptomyces sp. NPDC087844]|uniref:helix-turn-helix domain-containing protein n=1 Tax=Streptomyces sp. NPDC087844 TaxID=3365805 RepID=UPI003810EB42
MSRIRRAAARLARPFRPASAVGRRVGAPMWVRGLTAGGRPVVLSVALLMCAPGEYHLAETAGWNDPFTYGMPVVLSAYAGIAAAVASTRRPGDRGRWSAIIGACLALGLAMAAQVVSHLITTGHVVADQPLLIAVTSLVPPAVVGHLLHLAASPPDGQDAPGDAPDAEDAEPSPTVPAVLPRPAVVPPGTRLLPMMARPVPTVTLEREDRQDADRTRELPPGTGQDDEDSEDGPPPAPPLMTSTDVADHYGIKPSTVRNWVAAGRIPVHSKDAAGRNLFHPDQLPKFQVGLVPA